MFFDDNDDRFLNPELLHVVHQELYAISSNLEVTPYALRSAPTHTEDGIPIRKLYVSNLPPKTTRTELFGVFAQYGFIKSCWLRMGDKGPNQIPTPTYAFVTFSDPADAHKALQAPIHEKTLRGRNLKTSPADSWHQPVEDAEGKVHWRPTTQRREDTAPATEESTEVAESTSNNKEAMALETSEADVHIEEESYAEENHSYNILDILNRDCLMYLLSFVPVRDLIRSERVSKDWQIMVQEYLQRLRMFKTSWWRDAGVTLTTAVLRRVLQRAGASLLLLHIDHHWSALNDRTAHIVGKFCPNLEELKVVGMHTKNWNPLIYGCKQLKILSFVSCNKLTDSSLVQLVKNESTVESLTVANNTHVTGLFLTGSSPQKLNSLAFYNCYSLQGTVLSAAIDSLPTLTTLKLDVCPVSIWKIVPDILNKLPKLKELSLSEYTSVEARLTPEGIETFCRSLATLTELKILNLSRNIYITNVVLKQIAQYCSKLESLNVSSCNARRTYPEILGVGDEGVIAVCGSCVELSFLDLSYLASLTDVGLAAVGTLPALRVLLARGNSEISSAPLSKALRTCPQLQEIDVCGCESVSFDLVTAAADALRTCPRRLLLRLAGTAVYQEEELEQGLGAHRLLTVDTREDRSDPHLRPDFVDRFYDEASSGSFDDLYDQDDFDEFFDVGTDDELFLDGFDDYERAYGYAPDLVLM